MLCMVTAITLPRQFHLGFVELEDPNDLKTARWLFPAYMALWAIAIVPIATAGNVLLPNWGDPDTIVLGLPIAHAGGLLTAFVFLGGFSAAAAMVMIETVALSAMISNELVLPWLARNSAGARVPAGDAAQRILLIRRASILVVLLLAWVYFTIINRSGGLAQLGFTSLTASAQLAPALVGAVLWRRGHAIGAICGIVGGMVVWLLWVVAPQLAVDAGQAGVGPPSRLPFEFGVLASLALNVALYVGVSLQTKPKLIDRVQATVFLQQADPTPSGVQSGIRGTVGDLRILIEQFLGREDAAKGFHNLDPARVGQIGDSDPVTPNIARAAERMLAGAIGASSARNVIAWALAGEGRAAADITQMLDEAAQAVQFSRELLHNTLDSLDQAVCVVDRDVRLIAWNARYLDLFGHEQNDIYVGKPLEELIRTTAPRRGESAERVEQLVEERIGPIRRREHQMFERDWANGLTLKVAGGPLASGDYVTSFIDVTELRKTARALAQSNELLEHRVDERTRELTDVVEQLALAKGLAERATRSQERFVAAASHDLLQPLHAARLFLGAASEDMSPSASARELVRKADISIDAADRLLKALLNLSRLEMHGVKPEFAPVGIGATLDALRREFDPLAQDKRVRLQVLPTDASVLSDPDLLRSVLQNLIGNAVRYTPAGGRVAVICRRAGQGVRIEVRDNGPGIPPAALPTIFKEFARLPGAAASGRGAGLGLAIAERVCAALGHELKVWSRVGVGSTFSVTAQRSAAAPETPAPSRHGQGMLRKLRVLCVDDELDVLDGLRALLVRWGVEVGAASTVEEAQRLGGRWDVVLADFQLGTESTGLDFLEACRGRAGMLALITANMPESEIARAAALGVEVIRKPLAPAALRAFLSRAVYAEVEEVL
jgi:PAS domain S-box-containing protein